MKFQWKWHTITVNYLLALCVLVLVAGPASASHPVRIATWNVKAVGALSTEQYDATVAVLLRLDADLVALQEVTGIADVDYLYDLAFELGYAHMAVSPPGPFDSLRTALLSDFPILSYDSWSSFELSGDPDANDLTRYPFEVTVDLSGTGDLLRLIITHLKSGGGNDDEFRRALEAYRLTQVTDTLGSDSPTIILGDLNADFGDEPMTPSIFTTPPSGLPMSFDIGSDIDAKLPSTGLLNDPFAYLQTVSSVLTARQLDGTDATRPESGRALDYILLGPEIDLASARGQVYDCVDEGLPGGLPLAGAPLGPTTCAVASDHLPVFGDLIVGTGSTMSLSTGDCLLNWAEDRFHGLFAPADSVTQYTPPEHYRYYRDTNASLRISDAGNRIVYVHPDGTRQDVGTLADWVQQAGCQPPPTQCLFDWAEQFAPGLFAPSGPTSVISFLYTYRYYPQTKSYLGLSSKDGHIWYLANGELVDAGPYAFWMSRSGCSS